MFRVTTLMAEGVDGVDGVDGTAVGGDVVQTRRELEDEIKIVGDTIRDIKGKAGSDGVVDKATIKANIATHVKELQRLKQSLEELNTPKKDFFHKPTYLTVSGQLSAETLACSLSKVYTFGPTFRAEQSHTTRHLSEFWMLEPEEAFVDMHGCMDRVESMLKFVVGEVVEKEEIGFFEEYYEKGLREKLVKVVERPFDRISYTEAVELLRQEIAKDRSKWKYPDLEWGDDLQTEHERYLCEKLYDGCVFVTDYPKVVKSFYMRVNEDGETVAAFDLLVPKVGELCGGSQREERLEMLERRMEEMGLDGERDYGWYLDLRRYGTVVHSGFGMGFERLVSYVTGMENVRDVIAFPRWPGHAEF
jgi:asparaginyl-tRNA synthetase